MCFIYNIIVYEQKVMATIYGNDINASNWQSFVVNSTEDFTRAINKAHLHDT